MSRPGTLDELRRRLDGRYAVERELGRGGMGAVYLARDQRLDRPVALKVLPAEVAGDPSLRERFLRETHTAASFSHPNIVPVHSVEEQEGLLAFAMGFIEGESLAERVERAGPLDARATVRLLQDIGYALAYAHGRRVVHRDIKPENIMLERATGRALLMDFGISRPVAGGAAPGAQGAPALTRVGEVVGTPEYMSPEQAAGDTVDGRSDLYSLGLVALFGLTGKPAFSGNSIPQILARQLTEAAPPAQSIRPDLPAPLAAAIDRCLAKEPAARFQSAEELVEAIDQASLLAPEIPLPIRLFAQEAGTLGLVLFFSALIGWLLYQISRLRDLADLDAMLPIVLLVAMGLTRLLQTVSAARRLAIAGFSPGDSIAGLRGVMEERAAMRAALRNDPDTRRRRRMTLWSAALQVGIGAGLVLIALSMRTPIGPRQYRVPPAAAAMVITASLLLGMALVLLVRSPFRMAAGEFLFRLVWLGPVGRGILRLGARGVGTGKAGSGPTSGRASRPAAAGTPAPQVPPTSGNDGRAGSGRLEALEARVSELEKWRDTAQRSR